MRRLILEFIIRQSPGNPRQCKRCGVDRETTYIISYPSMEARAVVSQIEICGFCVRAVTIWSQGVWYIRIADPTPKPPSDKLITDAFPE